MTSACLSMLSLIALVTLPASCRARPLAVTLPLALLLSLSLTRWECLASFGSAAVALAVIILSLLVTFLPMNANRASASKSIGIEGGNLSQREAEVVSMLLSGNDQIGVARSLGIKPSTVGTYRRRALEKLHVASIAELALVQAKNEARRGDDQPKLPTIAIWIPLVGASVLSLLASSIRSMDNVALLLLIAIATCTVSSRLNRQMERRTMGALSFTSGLTSGMVLRAVTLGQLPFWTSLLVACLPPTVTIWRMRREHLAVRPPSSEGLATVFAVASTIGLSVGPISNDVANIRIGNALLLNWGDALSICTAIALGSLFLLANEIVDSSYQVGELLDSKRAVHSLQGRGLSELESRILVLIAQGESSSAVEKSLSVAHGTVSSSRARGYRILGIHSRAELIKLLSAESPSKRP